MSASVTVRTVRIDLPEHVFDKLPDVPSPMLRVLMVVMGLLIRADGPVVMSGERLHAMTLEKKRPVSRASASKSLKALVKAGVFNGKRDGNLWVLSMPEASN